MRLGRFLVYAVVAALVVYVAGYLALSRFVQWGLSGTTWYSTDVLGGGASDDFAVPDQTVGVQAARENLQSAFDDATFFIMEMGFALSLIWAAFWYFRAPSVAGPIAARSLRLPWYMHAAVAVAGLLAAAYYSFTTTALGSDLAPNARWIVASVYMTSVLLFFWLSTAWPTPNVVRPSVPGSQLFPLHGARS